MPIHDLGYRHWESNAWSTMRWWVIAQTGIRLAWKSHWLRRMLLIAWLPAVGMGAALFAYERSLTADPGGTVTQEILRLLPNSDSVLRSTIIDPAGARGEIWGFILLTFFRYPQGLLMVLLVGLIAPSLIARDMRSRAYLLYFSRPLGRADYVLGKCVIVWFYLAMITTVPAMALYVLGVFLSPSLSVVSDTWDLPLRILGASVWLIVPTTAVALCFSSLTSESRYAGFAWFVTWILGWVAYSNLTFFDLQRAGQPGAADSSGSRWALVSLYHSLGRVQSWVFGLENDAATVIAPLALLMLITLVSFAILFRRVSAPLRA